MKLFRYLIGYLCLTIGFVSEIPAAEVPVSPSAILFLKIENNPADPGISWLYNGWVKTPRKSDIREIAIQYSPSKGIVALYPTHSADQLSYAIILSYPRDIESDNSFTGYVKKALESDIKKGSSFTRYTTSYSSILYSRNTINHKNIGYSFCSRHVTIGSDIPVIQNTINILKQRQSSIATQPDFIQLSQKLAFTPDILIYCQNDQQQFNRFLTLREKKWKIRLLLSGKDIRAILIGIDVVDTDKLRGTMVFKAATVKAIPDITDDANFLGEAIRRKFVEEKTKWNSKVTTSGDYVTLQFDIAGLKPLWQELFRSGGLSLVQ